ncbi:Nitrous oxidase accessory protein [Ignisphaera aggregans DSM 17230]|uniref:Nitrous oxidase accessory protein n=1 Tax=Ignisphaera aggregans (strain DSM 17230 / JCM 13409 / AQ1.S1) TaxID=583356 RepID=E0STL8_IGNAA|nr:Nitrous oxidase accessory protein [Ignisphaera aggregans DSM 17230]
MHRTTIIAITIILINIITPLTTTINTETSIAPIKWVKYINPTDKDDGAYGTCIFGDYIAVVGRIEYNYTPSNIAPHPYIVLLDRDSGEIVREWIGEEIGGFANCISIGDKLYVVGSTDSRGVIYVFDENLNIVDKVMNSYSSVYESIVYGGSYIYIGGVILKDVDGDEIYEFVWLVEKRTVDLDLVSSREIYPGPRYSGYLYDIDVNSVTGDIWAVGWYYTYINQTFIGYPLIAILNNNLNNVKLIDYPEEHKNYLGELISICFDNNGYAYIAANYGVAKFDPRGNLVTVNKKYYSRMILCIGNKIYIFRDPYIYGYSRHVLTALDNNLNLVDEYVLSRDIDANSYFWPGKASFDGESIYVAGVDRALGENNWRIVVYSIAVEQPASTIIYPTTTPPSKTSSLTPRKPIRIIGDKNFTQENGVVSGSGTADDPYIIEGWEINALGYDDGIYIANTRAYFIIRNCKIYWASWSGIHLENVTNGKITNNTITNNSAGINLWHSSNNIIEYNNIVDNSAGIDLVYSSNNVVKYNNITNNYYGVRLLDSSSNVIVSNVFVGDGLLVYDSYNNTVLDNTVNGKPLIYLENVGNHIVSGNVGQVVLVNCYNITVTNLNLSSTTVGIELWNTNNSVLKYNNIANNGGGLVLVYSSNNVIEYNNIANNKAYGIGLEYSSNNVIVHNNIANNKGEGIYLLASSNNVIAGNNFINSRQVISYHSDNTWDLGYPMGGNYWSDHSCTDRYRGSYQNETEGDGICDKPYPIYDEGYNGYQYDRYPLVNPVNITLPTTTPVTTTVTTTKTTTTTISPTTTTPQTTTTLVTSTTTTLMMSKTITTTMNTNTIVKPSTTSITVLTTSTISPTTTTSPIITPTTTIATTQLAPPLIQNPIFNPIFIALPITVIAIPFISYGVINYKKKRDEERIRRRIEKIIRDIDELLNR